MSKAYDRVNWNFLKAVLLAMNFDSKWIKWIMECVSTVEYTLLLNGSMTRSFKPSQGLRQGGPLSPYLFLLCANVLSISLTQAEELKKIKGVKVGSSGLSFSHLLFVDDSLLFFRKDNVSIQNLQSILNCTYSISGQSINLAKSYVFCSPNMPLEEQQALARTLQVNFVQHPSKYLGVHFKLKGNRIADFQFRIDKLKAKLQGWKIKLLSQVSRTTLITSVLQSLPLYTFACFKIPEYVCNKMDSIIRAFWWGHECSENKLHLVHWDKVSQPRKFGGLGIKKFRHMNQVMLHKQYWRISQNPQLLLTKTSKARYFPTGTIQDCRSKPHYSWVWRSIIQQENHLLKEGRWRVGNGYNIPLNHRNWFTHRSLHVPQNQLPTGNVGDLINHHNRMWKVDLVRNLYSFPQATKILRIPISKTDSMHEKLLWKFSREGNYQVKRSYELCAEDISRQSKPWQAQNGWWRSFWKIKVPLKISIFIWKPLHNGLPTYLNLHIKGITNVKCCPICNEEEESLTHLFLHCPFARACWHGSMLSIHTIELNHISVQ